MRVGHGDRSGRRAGALAAGLLCWGMAVCARAQAPDGMAAAIQAAAANAPPGVIETAFVVGGSAGGLHLYAVRQTPDGPCRTFLATSARWKPFTGDLCAAGNPPRWSIRSIHPVFQRDFAASAGGAGLAGLAELRDAPAGAPSRPYRPPQGLVQSAAPPPPPPPPPVPAAEAQAAPPANGSAPQSQPAPPAPQSAAQPAQGASGGIGAPAPPIANQVKNLPIVYNKPAQLAVDRDTAVSLVVASADLARATAALANFSGAPVQGNVPLTPEVTARLTGDPEAVSITARAPETQMVTTLGNVAWVWDVRAKRPGQTSLTLQLFDNLMVEGKSTPVQIAAYTDRFDVSADVISWLLYEIPRIDPIWKFLGLGTPVALLAGAYALWRRRAKSARA